MRSRPAILLTVALLLVPVGFGQAPQALTLTGDFWGTHDPSIMKAGNTWYVFATGKARDGGQFQIRCSTDLHDWKLCGHVFDAIPDWIKKDSPGTQELWAPDISYEKGEYRLYYAYSLFGKNTSGIALATNRTLDPQSPDYRWVDHGLVLKSVASDDFNAIDPNYVTDEKGHAWLVFGSFWTGIKMRKLDDRTGLLSEKDTKVYALATRKRPASPGPDEPNLPPGWEAIEAPFIVHHGGYYYLFVSWDMCCRGTKSNYRTMVGEVEAGDRPIRGSGWRSDDGRRRYIIANGERAVAGAGRRVGADAAWRPGHHRLSRVRRALGQTGPADFHANLG
jgi:arabinan endo-1,5-alpha-L-arabinosidase